MLRAMTTTDPHADVDAEPGARHGWWAGFFIIAALLVVPLAASAVDDARILVAGVFITLVSVGRVFLSANLRRPSS